MSRKLRPRICGECQADLSRENHTRQCPYYDEDFDDEVDRYAHTAQANPATGLWHYPDGGSPTFDDEQ